MMKQQSGMPQIEALTENVERLKNAVQPALPEDFSAADISSGLCSITMLKDRLKECYYNSECRILFSQFMSEDPSVWPQKSVSDKQITDLSEQHNQVKAEIKEMKDILEETLPLAERTYEEFNADIVLLQTKIQDVKEKSQKLEIEKSRKSKLEELRNSQAEIDRIRRRIEELRSSQQEKIVCERMENALHVHKDLEKYRTKIHKERKEKINSLRVIKANLCRFNGLHLHPSSPSTIKIEFLSEKENSQTDDPRLFLIMEFTMRSLGNCEFTGAKVSIDSLPIEDIVEEAIQSNNVPKLVTSIQHRWQTHFPLAQEMLHISEHHAVDWMREEGLVRVLAGANGSVVCTLSLPQTYPSSGTITLTKISGTDISVQDVMPLQKDMSLKEWVLFLEEKFGKGTKSKDN